jgi:hypothetical protein
MNKVKISKYRLYYLRIEMYCYHETKKMIENTEQLTTRKYNFMENIVKAIDMSLEITEKEFMGLEKVKLIKDMYWYSRHLIHDALALKHYVHVNTVRNWERDFFIKFSDILGLTLRY